MAGLSLLRVVSNNELDRQERDRQMLAELQARQSQPLITGLAAYIRTCWEAARMAKMPIEQIMLKAKRQRNGEYEPDKLAEINRQGGSAIYMRLTEVKCRAAESWIRDILMDDGAPPWELNPTPLPSLSPEQTQEIEQIFTAKMTQFINTTGSVPEDMYSAKQMVTQDYRFKLLQTAQERADRMADKIKDQFAEGGWYEAFNDFVTDLVTYPAAIIKGPIVRRQRTLAWEGTTVKPVERLAPEFERVDPFRFYPEPGMTCVDDGYVFEHHPLSRADLSELIGVPGYDDEAIRYLLKNGAGGNSLFFTSIEMQKRELERKFHTEWSPTLTYDALEFWGKINGQMLLDWGMREEDVPDPAKEYDANVWLVGDKVIKASLNYDPLGRKPYAKSSFFKVPGAFWGMGIPEVIEDVQSVCNAAARSLVNNMAIASGPQVEVNIDRVPTNEDITQLYPWKVWQVLNNPSGTAEPAVRFMQPSSNAAELMKVYERFAQIADEHSGIPSYVSGDISVTGAGRTSSGLSMLMGAAGKGIRQVVSYIDADVIKVIVTRQFIYNMRYDDDPSIKGDVIVMPRGAVNLALKETTNQRRIEFLTATMNPLDAEIMGQEGRASILREVAKGLQMSADAVVPSREKLEFRSKVQAMQGQQPGTTPTDPAGDPKGGQAGNTVTNQFTGAS